MAREPDDATPLPEPAPVWVTRGAWLSSALTYALLAHWVFGYLGGPSASPDVGADGSVSTDRLFNWHVLLMPLAFGVIMSEAVLAYRAPYAPRDRALRKRIHWALHSCAALCIIFGLIAVWRSHDLKQPPIPNLYSPHSYLGVLTLSLGGLQFSLGAYSYLWPKLSLSNRQALGPLHRFLGQTTYVMGLATMAVGIQEKTTFVQVFGKKDVRSGFVVVPALAAVFLALTGALVMFHFTTPAAGRSAQLSSQAPRRASADERRALAHDLEADGNSEVALLGQSRGSLS